MPRSLMEMTVEIVRTQVSMNKMSAEEVEASLFKTYKTLKDIRSLESEVEEPVKDAETDELAVLRENPLKSLQRDKVISLENGQEFKVITKRHLGQFGLTAKEYKKKWGIPLNQPLAAKALTAKRKKWAKERGLGEMLKKARAEKAPKKVAAKVANE